MAVPLLDLGRQYSYLRSDMDKAVLAVLEHGKFILGPEVETIEAELAKLSGVGYGIGVASGTDALLVALRACGVSPGDEVITSNFSFFASAGVISRLGATPVFVDIDPDTYNIDVDKIEGAVTERTKVIMPVHLFGQLADMDAVLKIARKHNLKVVEDAAQAVGAEHKGRPAGSFGDFGCFSFYPSKNLGGGGDGGLIVTDSEQGYLTCRSLRAHGENPKYYHRVVGYNSRLHTLQAAILLVKLPYLRRWSEKRQAHAKRYDEAFGPVAGLKTPVAAPESTFHIYNQYTIEMDNRDQVMKALADKQIGHCIYYPVPFHRQDCFADLGYAEDMFPASNRAAERVLSIPIYPEMTDEEQTEVIETIIEAIG